MGLALDELKENDRQEEINGIDVLFDAQVCPWTAGQVLDFVSNHRREGFVLSPSGERGGRS